MNRQDLFDRALAHMRTQGKKSMTGSMCAYRGPDGTKCAIGGLIPDELYNHQMEGERISSILNRDPDETPIKVVALRDALGVESEGDLEFLVLMQITLHDHQLADMSDLEGRARILALKCGLEYAPPVTA